MPSIGPRTRLKTWAIPEEDIQAVRDEVKNFSRSQDKRAKDKDRLKQWARVELKAPDDGFIIEQNVALHETVVDNTTNLFQIAKVDPLIVLAAVPEDDLPALQDLKSHDAEFHRLDGAHGRNPAALRVLSMTSAI